MTRLPVDQVHGGRQDWSFVKRCYVWRPQRWVSCIKHYTNLQVYFGQYHQIRNFGN